MLSDLRYAARTLRGSPGFAALAIAIMTLGIGANTAVFSVINAVLFEPLPYRGADRIVTVSTLLTPSGEINPLVSIGNFQDWRDQSISFDAMATYRGGEFPVAAGSAAEYARAATVDNQFFGVFAVSPILGRAFTPEDLASGGRVALISYDYWRSRFGGSADVLQRTVRVRNDPWQIVGVMPAGFQFPQETQLWFPQTTIAPSRTRHNLFAVGRLKAGVPIEQANAELRTIGARLEQQYSQSNQGRSVLAIGLQDRLVGGVRTTLYILWGVVALVLLIACANTATLLLGRAAARTREMSVRTALGASRGRIVRQLVSESLLLSLIAGGSGMLLAYWGAKALAALAPFAVVRSAGLGLDGGVLVFTLVISLATSLLFGLVPALQASRVDLTEAIKRGGARSVTGGRLARTRALLVVSEIALAVMLLTGAGLLTKSLISLYNVDLGYRADNVLVMKASGVRTLAENNAFFTEVMTRIAALPGISAVGATSIPPGQLADAGSGSYFIDRKPEVRDRATAPEALFTIVAPGAFSALGVPLKSGRDFEAGDLPDRPLVAIVNEALVRRSLPGQNPIGRTIYCSFDRSNDPMTIVGVVGDARQRNPALEPMPECYMPYRQHSYNNATLHVVMRTVDDPASHAAAVRQAAADVSANVPVSFTTLEAMTQNGVAEPRFRSLLFGLFAGLAVCLAMAGVYGVVAYSVEQRAKEIGVRMAMGASGQSVQRMILRQGLVLGAAGLAIGLAGAAAATRLLESVLFNVQPLDVQVYVAVVLLLAVVTLAAGFLPARRAACIDPMQLLKAD